MSIQQRDPSYAVNHKTCKAMSRNPISTTLPKNSNRNHQSKNLSLSNGLLEVCWLGQKLIKEMDDGELRKCANGSNVVSTYPPSLSLILHPSLSHDQHFLLALSFLQCLPFVRTRVKAARFGPDSRSITSELDMNLDAAPGPSRTAPKPQYNWERPNVDREIVGELFMWVPEAAEPFNYVYKIEKGRGGGNKGLKEIQAAEEDIWCSYSLRKVVVPKRIEDHSICANDKDTRYASIFPSDQMHLLVFKRPQGDDADDIPEAVLFFHLCDCAGCKSKGRMEPMEFSKVNLAVRVKYENSDQTRILEFVPGYTDRHDLWKSSSDNVIYFLKVLKDGKNNILPKNVTFQTFDPQKLMLGLAEDPTPTPQLFTGAMRVIHSVLEDPDFYFKSCDGGKFAGKLVFLTAPAPMLKRKISAEMEAADPASKKTKIFLDLPTDKIATHKLWRWINFNDTEVLENTSIETLLPLLDFALEYDILDMVDAICADISTKAAGPDLQNDVLLQTIKVMQRHPESENIARVCSARREVVTLISKRFGRALKDEANQGLPAYQVFEKLFGAHMDLATCFELFADVCKIIF
ncbi:unnamed protein product [Orchesella dallaii]|uniref:Uncharacterized protein n=1 Tax=Orchesella dallaii TaxID=48710 RepID=A0ABP1QK90_9HEXA